MNNKKMDWLERDIDFKYDGTITYFCIFSLFILFGLFGVALLVTGFHYIEDLTILFAAFIFFISFYFYVGVYIITKFYDKKLVKKCLQEIKYFEKSTNILTISNFNSKRSFGYWVNTDFKTGIVFITKHKLIKNKKYEIFELEFSEQKLYFAKEILEAIPQKVKQKKKYKVYSLQEVVFSNFPIKAP